MKVYNRSGELVELPTKITREQTDAALAALGLPKAFGLRKAIIGPFDVTLSLNLLGDDGRNAPGGTLRVTIPRFAPPQTPEG